MRLFKTYLLGLALAPVLCGQVDRILSTLKDPSVPGVLVAAHRSDWRNAPENSLAAMRRAIRLGADIIEVDVHKTKDGKMVIIHDDTLDRTTTGKGLVANYTLADLRKLKLLAATGHPTNELIPTLEEALDAVRGRAVINLDKSYNFPEETLAVVKACHAVDYSLFSVNTRLDVFNQLHPQFLKQVMFMIVVPLWRPDAREFIREYLERSAPTVVQVTFDNDHLPIFPTLRAVYTRHARLWFNALWPEQDGGHDDERAVDDPDGAYGWMLAQNVGVIQTDRPAYLLEYLRLHHARPTGFGPKLLN